MGRGGYSGGSTIIYPGGRGWSYDPLSSMPGTKGKKSKKKAKAKKPKNTPTSDNFLEYFSLSCACCKILGMDWPGIGDDERRAPLLDAKTKGYHKPFRDKVGRQRKKANRILLSYAAQCAASDKKGEERPKVPKSIRFAAEVKGFSSRLEGKIKERKNPPHDQAEISNSPKTAK